MNDSVRQPRTTTPDKRRVIESAAARLFAKRGYEGVSMREIASAAKVQLGSLTYYYADKQELYDQVVKAATEHFGKALIQAATRSADSLENLKSFIGALVRLHRRQSVYGHIIARELAEGPNSRFVKSGRDTFKSLRQVMGPIVKEVAKLDSAEAADRLTGQLIQMVYAATRGHEFYRAAFGMPVPELDDQIEDLQALALYGVIGSVRK